MSLPVLPGICTPAEARTRLADRLSRRRRLVADPETAATVTAILHDIQEHGDTALIRYAARYDQVELTPATLRVSPEEIDTAENQLPDEMKAALRLAAARIEAFHLRQKEDSWLYAEAGTVLGQLINPLDSVGLYIPGGKAAYPSTLLMNAIPARLAGVPRRVLCTPARDGLSLPPVILFAARLAGITEIYRVGGAQAIGAMALGTETICPVDKITGPGNRFVTEAKRQVFGLIAIDMIAGPSEVLIISDGSLPPEQAAVDLFAQAEHDQDAAALLATTSRDYALAVQEAVTARLAASPRAEIIRASLEKNGLIILAPELDELYSFANDYAPEHLEIIIDAGLETILGKIRNAGAVFFGKWTPEALGDYTAGPNHTLPTAGTARFSSPLGVYDFVKRSSLLSFTREGFTAISRETALLADTEGLHSHAESVRLRLKKGEPS